MNTPALTWDDVDGALAALEHDAELGDGAWAHLIASHLATDTQTAMKLILRIAKTARQVAPANVAWQVGLAATMGLLVGHKLGRARGVFDG